MKYKLTYSFFGGEGNYHCEEFDTKEEAQKRQKELYKRFGNVICVFIDEVK